jgi:hypothetical protein
MPKNENVFQPRNSLPIPRTYHNVQSFENEQMSPFKTYQEIPQNFSHAHFVPVPSPHINNFVNIQNQQNFPSSHMNQMQNSFTPMSNQMHSTQYSHFYSTPNNMVYPPGSSMYSNTNYGQYPSYQRDSLDVQIQRNPQMKREYSKKSLEPLMRKNQSYIEMTSMNSIQPQFFTEDYGNDEFYSNLEEEYFQKVILKNKHKRKNNRKMK